jgi:hypothetical protein
MDHRAEAKAGAGLSRSRDKLRSLSARARAARAEKGMQEPRPFAGLLAARAYAGIVCLCGLALAFIAGVSTQTHAAGAAGVLLLLGVLMAALAPPIWRTSRAAMIAAVLVGVVTVALYARQDPRDWWMLAPVPALFAALAAAAIAAGAKARPHDPWRPGRVAAALYAAAVYAYSVVVVFVTPTKYAGGMLSLGPPGITAYAFLLGLIFAALSIAIWRARPWAMLAGFALALLHWLVLARVDGSFWRDGAYWSAALAFGALTVVCLALRRSDRIA